MSNSYDCQDAMILMAMAIAEGKEPDVASILIAATDIPEGRIEFAASEISQIIVGLEPLVMLLKLAAGGDEAKLQESIRETMGKTKWTDDDKGDLTIRAYMETEDEGDPLVTVKTKLKR